MKICEYLYREKQPLTVVIIGAMGSGKTTLAHLIHHECFNDYEKMVLNDIDEINTLQGFDKLYIIFDDYSYKLRVRTKEEAEKLTNLFRIRHILGTDKIIIVFAIHYLRSISVFIRNAQVRILTSITEPEVKMYARDYLFRESTLWDTLHYKRKYPEKYIIAYCGVNSGEHILDMTIDNPEEIVKVEKREKKPLTAIIYNTKNMAS